MGYKISLTSMSHDCHMRHDLPHLISSHSPQIVKYQQLTFDLLYLSCLLFFKVTSTVNHKNWIFGVYVPSLWSLWFVVSMYVSQHFNEWLVRQCKQPPPSQCLNSVYVRVLARTSLVPRPLTYFILQPGEKLGESLGSTLHHGPEMVDSVCTPSPPFLVSDVVFDPSPSPNFSP